MPHAGPGRGAVLKVHALNAGDLDSVQALQKKKKKPHVTPPSAAPANFMVFYIL